MNRPLFWFFVILGLIVIVTQICVSFGTVFAAAALPQQIKARCFLLMGVGMICCTVFIFWTVLGLFDRWMDP